MYVNGQPYGLATDFAWSSETAKKPLYTVDSPDAFELAPTTTRINGSMSIFRQSGDGGAEGAGLAAPQNAMTRERYFSLVLKEIHADIIIFQATRCSLTAQSWQVGAAKGYMRGQLTFSAIDWANEATITVSPFK